MKHQFLLICLFILSCGVEDSCDQSMVTNVEQKNITKKIACHDKGLFFAPMASDSEKDDYDCVTMEVFCHTLSEDEASLCLERNGL